MADDPDILTIKQNEQLMLEALGIERMGSHCPCPLCHDKTGLRVGLDKKGSGVYLCQCMKCNDLRGDVFSVYKLVHNQDFGKAANLLRSKLGMAPYRGKPHANGHKPPLEINTEVDAIVAKAQKGEAERQMEFPATPEIRLEEAEKFVQFHHEYLLNSASCVQKYMKDKRGISEEVAVRYRLGFIERAQIKLWSEKKKSWYSGTIEAAWVFPVTDWKGNLKAVKIHHEIIRKDADGNKLHGKCQWMPFGKDENKPNVSIACFWPHLYSQSLSIKPVNFTTDPWYWIKRLPDGSVKDAFERMKTHNAQCYAIEKQILEEEIPAPEWDKISVSTFEEMQKEIQKEVLAHQQPLNKEQSFRSLAGWNIWAPGELKAFAFISAGLRATALTTGESFIPPPGMLRCFRGSRVAVNRDDDVPYDANDDGKPRCTGINFVHNAVEALTSASPLEVRVFTWGRKVE